MHVCHISRAGLRDRSRGLGIVFDTVFSTVIAGSSPSRRHEERVGEEKKSDQKSRYREGGRVSLKEGKKEKAPRVEITTREGEKKEQMRKRGFASFSSSFLSFFFSRSVT